MKSVIIATGVVLFLSILGCTAGSGGASSIFTESSKEASTNEAEKQIEDIQSKINSDPNYVLNSDEAIFLSEQGVIADQTELKGWVK